MGDYVRVAVPAPQGQSLAAARRFLQTTEDQARDHIMFESSASYPESDEGVEEDQAESGSTLYGAPDSTSEPEPHATCQLQGHGKLEALVTACNAVGTGDVDLALHCLAGRYIGVRKINVQRPVTSAGIHTAISHAWKDLPAGLGIIVHPILPQPWTSQSFALHFIAEFLPYTFWPKRRLVNPHLRQLVTTGVAGVDVCFEAFYATEGDEREPGGLQSVYGPFVPGFESQFWEDAERQLRTIHKYRDTLSHRVYRLHFHCIDTDGRAQGSKTCRTPAELLADPKDLINKGLELWHPCGEWNLTLLPAQGDTAELHFAVEDATQHRAAREGIPTIVEVLVWKGHHLQETYRRAIRIDRADSDAMIYNKLQLDRVLSITAADIALPLQWQESRLTVHRRACEHWCTLKGTAGPYPYREVHGITSIPPRHDDPSHQPRGVIISPGRSD